MLKRNLNQHMLHAGIGVLIFPVLLALSFVLECSFAHSVPQSMLSDKKWPCIKGKNILRDNRGRPVWLTSSELFERVIDKQPLKIPALLGKNKLKGDVTIQVLIDKDGKIECCRGVKGNPLAISSAMESVPKWVFNPYTVNGEPKPVLGILTIPYDFSQ